MSAFAYKLEREDGTPANPPRLKTAVPNWSGADAAIGVWNAGETQKKEEAKIAEAAAEWDAYMQKVKEQAEVQAQYEGNGSVPGYDPGCEDPELYGC